MKTQDNPQVTPPPEVTKEQAYLRTTGSLIGDKIKSKDDETCGKVRDFLFDDADWTVRYVVGDSGGFLSCHKILLSPFVFENPEFGTWTESVPTVLSKEWIETSPPLEADAPVSERYELELARHYNYAPYWKGASLWGVGPYPVAANLAMPTITAEPSELTADEKLDAELHEQQMEEIRKSHLRSCEAVTGYTVEANGEEIGKVADFIVETRPWRIRYLVVHTGGWLSGRKVLFSPEWTQRISWHEGKFFMPEFARERVENAPTFDPGVAINRSFEGDLYDYYGRPHYW